MTTDAPDRGHPDEAVLNALADGSLPRAEEARAEAHLRSCVACRAELRALREVVAEARDLPRGIAPPRDLWPGVRERIGGSRGGSPARRWLAAAAVLLVAAGAGVTALLLEGGDAGGPASSGDVAGGTPGAPRAVSPARPASVGESYRGAVERLSGILERRGDELPPETRQVLERNLEIIDEAIAEAESALARNPGSPAAVRALDRSYRRKIDVLQRSARLASQL